MFGNWAMGRLNMLIAPTIIMTMEITMATMGRLIKNFDIGLPSLTFRPKRLGVYLHARTHLLHALGNHPLAALQSLFNNPLRADAIADIHRPVAHFVLAIDHGYLIAALQFLDCTLRYK